MKKNINLDKKMVQNHPNTNWKIFRDEKQKSESKKSLCELMNEDRIFLLLLTKNSISRKFRFSFTIVFTDSLVHTKIYFSEKYNFFFSNIFTKIRVDGLMIAAIIFIFTISQRMSKLNSLFLVKHHSHTIWIQWKFMIGCLPIGLNTIVMAKKTFLRQIGKFLWTKFREKINVHNYRQIKLFGKYFSLH